MPYPKKPNALKLITGSRQPKIVDAPEFDLVTDFPDPPSHLNINGVEMWSNLGKQLVNARVLQVVDLYVLEQLCFMWQIFRQKAQAGMEMTASENNAMKGMFSEMGMTPASRNRVTSSHENKPANRFANNGVRTL